MSDTPRKLGPIGDRVIFENEAIRVWIVDLQPGEKQPWHRHDYPYLIVPMTEGANEIHFESGRVVHTGEKPGVVLWREVDEVHELRNTSSWHYQNILVEMKLLPRRPGTEEG